MCIPVVVIEFKSPKVKVPIDKAIEQHLRNQQEDGIRLLYQYFNLVIGLAIHGAGYLLIALRKGENIFAGTLLFIPKSK